MQTDREPGSRFVDAHVHFSYGEKLDGVLSAGISAVRNAGMRIHAEKQISARAERRSERPIEVTSCWAIHKRGGYGSRFGAAVDTDAEIKAEIRKLKKAGADIIKVMASGIVSLKKAGTVTSGGFSSEQLRLIVQEAADLGLGVMAHANGKGVIAAVEAGVRSVEHGFFMTRSTLDQMAKKRIYWVPTVGALARALQQNATADVREFVADLIRSHLEMLGYAYEIGVALAVGTDCVFPDPFYREAYQSEISLFERAGIPREAVVQIAREGGARLLGLAG